MSKKPTRRIMREESFSQKVTIDRLNPQPKADGEIFLRSVLQKRKGLITCK
jgi:hypothetical protein